MENLSMSKFFRFGSLSLLTIVSLTSPALADECKKIHGTIVDTQVIEGCTSPNKFCAEGTVTLPGSLATSGVLVYTTDSGTLTVRESGLSNLSESGQGYFTAFQQVLEGTGEYEGATGHLWVLG